LRTRLPASVVAPPGNRARYLMTNTLASPPPPLRLSDPDISPVTPTLTQAQPSGAALRRQTEDHPAPHHPFARSRADRQHPRSARSAAVPIRDRKIKSNLGAKSP